MENIFNRTILLPNYFKKIALALLLGIFVFIIFKKVGLITIDKLVHSYLNKQVILIAFLFLAFSKDKVEDELIAQIRYRAITSAFLYGSVFWLFSSIFVIVFKSKSQHFNEAPFILYLIFIWYFYVFYKMKKLRLK